MLTPEEIESADDRLEDGKLSLLDIDKLVTVFRLLVGALETVYRYKFVTKLSVLTDEDNNFQKCAQLVACLIKMEELGFPVGELTGSSFGIKASEHVEFRGYALYAFSKIYPLPPELTGFVIQRRQGKGNSNRIYIDRRFINQ